MVILQKILTGGKVDAVDFEETFKFILTDKLLYVDAGINNSDSTHRFIFDTYAVNLARQDLISRLNLDVTKLTGPFAKQLEGSMLAPTMVTFERIRLGNLQFQGYGGFAIREDQTHDILDYLEDGIIGANLMNKFIWQINFRDSTIKVTDTLARCDFIEGAVVLPFKPHSLQQSPDIQVLVNSEETLNLQFDTGSNSVLKFNTDKLDSYIKPGRYAKRTSVPSLNMGEEQTEPLGSHLIKLDSIQIGSQVFHDLPVEIYEVEEKELIGRGQLGNGFMRHFIVTVDWLNNKIYLFPRPESPLETQKRSFGLSIGWKDEAVRIISFYEDSEAAKLSLKIGDRVLSVNGKDMTNLSKEKIRLYIQGYEKFIDDKDKKVQLKIDSGGSIRTITLRSYDLFRK
ncbi:MAG: PDZ domain-containing protein [Candidatus Aminicenantes bacterium]|nr:PDZ domain-containing protein [Candidatus Aminicenantes bacterium]